jgi:hypothetical protein
MQDKEAIKNAAGIIKYFAIVKDSDDIQQMIHVAKNYELAVTMGQIDGYSALDKYGENPVIETTSDPEDIWEGGGEYTYDADGTAPIVSIISTSSGDTQDIKIVGLDINGDEVEQIVALTGNVRKALTTPLWRVYRMENEGTTDLAGTVYCYIGTGGVPVLANQRALIDNGNNQTLMALYTVPKGKVGFLYRGEVGINFSGTIGSGIQFARLFYKSRRFGKVFKVKKSVSIINSANSVFQDKRSFPDIIPALTDIRLTVTEVSDTMGAWGTFDILLVDEGKFPVSFLQKIKQLGY